MGIFNSIKKSRRASSDIDEKIEYLNKELEKTGLREGMTTSNMYFGGQSVDNQDRINFNGLSHGGYPLGLSAADGNHIGGAITQTIPVGFFQAGLEGVAYSPPHPITGQRTYAVHVTSGLGDTIPLRPGVTIPIGFSDNPPKRTMGSALWFFDPNYSAGGVQGRWCNFEYSADLGGLGHWDTVDSGQFAGVYFFNTNLSQHSCGDVGDILSGINFGENGIIGPPKTIVLNKNDLDDPGFLPIVIDLSVQAFNYLKDKAGQALDFMKGNFDSNMEGMGEKLKEHWSKSFQQAKNFMNTLMELGSGMSDQAFCLFDALNNVYAVSSIVADARKNGDITSDNQIREGAKGSISNPHINTVSDAVAAHILKGVDIGGKDMGKQIQQNVSASPLDGTGNWGSKGIHNKSQIHPHVFDHLEFLMR